jgi:LysM repeat protein
MIRAILLLLALAPLAVRAQSAGVVAGLQQDVAALRDEVRLLRAEIEEVKEAQTRIRSSDTPAKAAPSASADLGAVNARIAAVESAAASARRSDKAELLTEVDRKVETLAGRVNKALADQTKQVNDALRSGTAARATETPATPKPDTTKPVETPGDMPKTGVRYTVVPGDSVNKIAKKTGSKPAWILAANSLRSNADLKAGATIFIPQQDAAGEAGKQ